MNKEITYGGYTVQPSDYECSDGELAATINVIPEDGSLKPVFPPKPILDCNLGGKVKLIHHVPNQDNYIILRVSSEGSQDLYWLQKSESTENESDAIFIASFNGIKDLAIIGNTIAVATDVGLRYALWKDKSYVTLTSKPPFLSISFGMNRLGICGTSQDLNISFERNSHGNFFPADSEENSNAVYGLLLSTIKEKIIDKGYFYLPFFVRYAYRLYDGSYSWHSAPVLMLPMVIPPILRVGQYSSGEGVISVPTQLNVPYFSLDYKILDDIISQLQDWKDIITGIDIFISSPIYTYDQSKRIKGLGDSRTVLLNSYYNWNPDGLNTIQNPDLIPDRVFIGHYGEASDSYFVDHYRSTDGASNYPVWELPLNDEFHNNIKDVSQFYKIASIENLSAMDSFKRLPIESKYLEPDILVTRPILTDDYQSHCDFTANHLYSFNSRLNIADLIISPPIPLPVKSTIQATSTTGNEQNVVIKVFTHLNGVLCFASTPLSSPDYFWDLDNNFPRYIYYPDPSAYKMVFSYGNNEIIIDLTPHDFLNGAYWYGNLGINPKPSSNAEVELRQAHPNAPYENRIYTSEVNNPFFFPIQGMNSVGSGKILGLATSAKALSQGQFGQFPLYAFTSEGVWAMEVSNTGLYTAKQPITRDVCINPESITQIDSAVLFPTKRGIMLISGSQTQCISDSINSDTPFDVLSFPQMYKLHSMLGHGVDSCLPIAPFSIFLNKCGMLYDYMNQRIIVYSPEFTYAYVYSLKSQKWGMMHSQIVSVINAYPEAMAVDREGRLIDFSQTNKVTVSGLMITRPLSFDAADVLKTVDTIIQRGNFRKGHVQSVLYASRDLINWHMVWSSKDHFLRGFRGTPYKYFRVALLCNLAPGESIFGASVQFTPRLTNQLR